MLHFFPSQIVLSLVCYLLYIPYSLCLLNYGKWGNSRTARLPVCVESGCSAFEWDGATEAESVSYEAGTSASSQLMATGLLSWPISVDFIIVYTVWGEEAAVLLFPYKINWCLKQILLKIPYFIVYQDD